MTLRRVLSGCLVLLALAILVGLGTWQLQRKAWKEALVADLASRAHASPIALPTSWQPDRDEFRHVFATGTFLNDKEVRVYGLFDGGRGNTLQGSFLFTPFKLTGGSMVMVNRGFVPKGETKIARIEGETRVDGILRAPEPRGWFVPENIPEKGQWFTRNSTAMAVALDSRNARFFYIEADALPSAMGPWPKGGTTRTITLRNDHLQYALTWFGLALVLLGVVGYAVLKNRPKRIVHP